MQALSNKERLLDSALRLVAKNGLNALSMQQITQKVGTSGSLIYRHYGTKENLLLQCYLSINREIAERFGQEKLSGIQSGDDLHDCLHKLWLKYFMFLLENSHKTLFCYEYRHSMHYRKAAKKSKTHPEGYFESFMSIFHVPGLRRHMASETDLHDYWKHILNVTIVIASWFIREKIPRKRETYEEIWRLIWSGKTAPETKAEIQGSQTKPVKQKFSQARN